VINACTQLGYTVLCCYNADETEL